MNETELKQYCLEHAGETLPAEAEALLSRDPELKKQVEQLIAVSRLISLKQYEQPHASCEQRCINAVNARIAAGENSGIFGSVREWFELQQPVALLSYAAAALVMCAAGIGLYLGGTAAEDVVVAVQEAPAAVETQVIPEPVVMKVESIHAGVEEQFAGAEDQIYPVVNKPLIVLQVSSNPQPSTPRMSFGSGSSVPVSFDY